MIPDQGTFTRDPSGRVYYLHGVAPIAWKQVVEARQVDQLRECFEQAFAFVPLT